MFGIPVIRHRSRAASDASNMMHLNALNGSLFDREDSPPRSMSSCLPSDDDPVFGLFSVGGGDAIHVHHHNSTPHHHDCHNSHQQQAVSCGGGHSSNNAIVSSSTTIASNSSSNSLNHPLPHHSQHHHHQQHQVQLPQSHHILSGRSQLCSSGPPPPRYSVGGTASTSTSTATSSGKKLCSSWDETRFLTRDDNAAERLDQKAKEAMEEEEDEEERAGKDLKKQQPQCERFSRISIVSNNSSLQTFHSLPESPRVDPHNAENKMAAKSSDKSGTGSGGWRKHLTVERSPLSVAKDKLYRVFSPKPSRKHDRQGESSSKGGHGKSKVQLPKTRGHEDVTELEATSHPMRLRIPSGRPGYARGHRDDDVRHTGAKQHHHHQQQQQQQQLKVSSHVGRLPFP